MSFYSSSESSSCLKASRVSVSWGQSLSEAREAAVSRLLMSLLGKEVSTLWSPVRKPSLLRYSSRVDRGSEARNLLCS